MTPSEAPIFGRMPLGEALGQVNQAIIRAQTREELFSNVCRLIVEAGCFNLARIDWLDTAHARLTPTAQAGHSAVATEEFVGHGGQMVMRSELPCVSDDGACAAYPLRLQNQVCGVLTVSAIEPCSLNGAETAFLNDVALNLSFAVGRLASDRPGREVEDALNEGHQLLQSVLQSGLDGFYLVDTHGRFLQVNDAYCTMSGYSREELLSMCVADVEASESPADVAAHMQNVIRRGTDRFESRHHRKDGQIIDVETSVNFQQYDGGRFFCFLRDVTERKLAEQALRESEERYRRLFANNPQPMWVFDVKTLEFLEVNDAAVAHYGYSREEFLGMTLEEIRSPEDVPALHDAISAVKNGYSFVQCARHRKKDGTNIYVEVSDYRFLQDDRLVSVILANDITERRRAEEAVRRSEARLRSFVENSPFGIFRTHVEEDRFLEVNPALVKMLGYASADEVLSLKLSTDVYFEVQEREKALTPLRRDGINRIEVRCKKKDGAIVIFHLSGRLVDDTVPGGQAFEGIASDVTEHKQAEQALSESEERFRLVVESAPMGIFIQTEGIHRYFNPAALAMLRAESPSQVVGRSYLEVMHPDSRASVTERARIVREEKKSVPFMEERLLRMDGTSADAEITAVPFVFEGRDGALVFLRDITERKREEAEKRALEQQLVQAQKMEAVGRLAGGIAHDFNNLLMVIQSYTEMLRDSLAADDELRKDTEQVLKAARRATSLTGQMLAFSRKQIINPVLVDLNAVISETAKMLIRLIGEDIEIRLDLADQLWATEADSDQIVQVLMNLCVNSRDAMPDGGTLSITTENVAITRGSIARCPLIEPGEYAKLSVTDTGTGIDRQTQERIFEPFYTTKEVGKGTGLGLAMVYGIVKQNSGFVWLESEPGHGACFNICLPRASGIASSAAPGKADVLPRGTETLLVAEDEEALRIAICGYLRSLGYSVLEASSGEQALAVADRHEGDIDLLITDVVMPKMSGREASQILTGQRSDLKTIYMSGYTDDAVLRHGIHKLGATFLQKPFGLDVLARKVRETLND